MGADRIWHWMSARATAISLAVAAALASVLIPAVTPIPQAVAAEGGAPAVSDSLDLRQRRGRTDYSGVISKLSADIPALMDQHKVVGLTIALVDGRRVVWEKGFGYADAAQGKPVTTDTLFPIGSVSKTLAAAAVMQLVERGLVSLDAPLSRYVPGFRLLPRYRGDVITVRSVLDHHSGIPGDVLNGLITSRRPDPRFRGWLLRALRQMYPERRVNTVSAYSNSAYVLLQNLVENVTGMGLERYAQRYLFGPMRMKSSHFDPTRAPAGRLTSGYLATFSPEGQPTGAQVQLREFVNGWAAGSITSSATDMSRYLRMLLAGGAAPGGRVLRGSTLRRMWTQQTNTAVDRLANYATTGLGWFLKSPEWAWAGKNRSHDGATVFVQSALRVLPDSDLGVSVSINTLSTGGLSSAVAHEALSLAYTAKTGIPEPPPARLPDPPAKQWSAAALQRRAGTYAANRTLGSISVTGDKLVLDIGAGPATYTPTSSGWFKPDQDGQPQIRFRKVAGRQLLLTRFPSGPAIMRGPVAERITPSPLVARWRHKFGSYRATNINPREAPYLVPERITLDSFAGVLFLQTDRGTVQALEPMSGKAAFTAGLGFELGRGKGDSVVYRKSGSGKHSFTYLGVRYVRTGPATASPRTQPTPAPRDVPLDWLAQVDSLL